MHRPKRPWPFGAALVLFLSVLGLLPHLRFGLLIGETAYFESAYDEATYALWTLAGGGPLLPSTSSISRPATPAGLSRRSS